MNTELFGELHEQEEYGLFGKEHERQQCFLHSVSNSFCDLYKKQCIGNLCSVTSTPEKCEHLKQNDC